MEWIIQALFSYFSTIGFGIIANIPRRALHASGIAGMISWLIFLILRAHSFGIGSANFFAAFFIGLASIFFSRRKKMPMIIFIVPSLVPLVPGAPAYQAVREFVLGNPADGFQSMLTVIITAGAIAAAFMMTNLVEQLVIKWHFSKKVR